jgi:hypothetical protein
MKELLWTVGSFASIAALALVVIDTFWIKRVRDDEEALMHELEGGQDMNLPLNVLAKKGRVVFVVIDREFADAYRDWSPPVRFKFDRDKFDGRIRHMSVMPASSRIERPPHKRRHPRRAPETKAQ